MRSKFLSAGAVLVVLAGCGGSGGGSGSSKPQIRFFNSIPDSKAIDFQVNETTAASSIPYGGSDQNFLSESSGLTDLTIFEHGQQIPLWSEADTLANNVSYIAVAIGEEGYGSETDKRPQFAFSAISRTAPNGTQAKLFIVHGLEEAAGVPTPNIDFTNPGQNPTFAVTNLAPGSITALTVNAGSQEFIARQTGTQGSYADQTFTLAAGGVYLMVVTGINGDTGAEAPEIEQVSIQGN
jgi:hypothetical protein